MFSWFNRRRQLKADQAAKMLAELSVMRLQIERQRLILEALEKDLLIDVVDSLTSIHACRKLVTETPSVAANLIHLQSKVWHNSSQILNAQEANRTPVKQSDR